MPRQAPTSDCTARISPARPPLTQPAASELVDLTIPDSELAWLLADEIRPYLTENERHWVFVDLGSGDYIAGIERMLVALVRGKYPLCNALRSTIRAWVNRYAGFADNTRLTFLLSGVTRPHPDRGSEELAVSNVAADNHRVPPSAMP
jgi:hypothetical protein